MKLRSLPLYALAFCLSVFMLNRIVNYNTEALEAASLLSADTAGFIDVSSYNEEDALFAFSVQEEQKAKFYYPFNGESILAFTGGWVEYASDGVVVIAHNDDLSTRYSGCEHIKFNVGDRVNAGDLLALGGSSAEFHVLYQGEIVDASLYLALTSQF